MSQILSSAAVVIGALSADFYGFSSFVFIQISKCMTVYDCLLRRLISICASMSVSVFGDDNIIKIQNIHSRFTCLILR